MAAFLAGHSRLITGNSELSTGSPAASNLSFTNTVFRRSCFAKAGRLRSSWNDACVALANPTGSELLPVITWLPLSNEPRIQRAPRIAPPKLPNALLKVIDWITRRPITLYAPVTFSKPDQATVLSSAAQPIAQHARAMGIVDPQCGQARQPLGQVAHRRDSTGRTEDAVGHQQHPLGLSAAAQSPS